MPSAAIDLLDRTAAAVRLCNKNSINTIKNFQKELQNLLEEKGDNISNSDLQMFYRMIFNKAGAVLTTKLSDTYVWNDDDDNKDQNQWIEKILFRIGRIVLLQY